MKNNKCPKSAAAILALLTIVFCYGCFQERLTVNVIENCYRPQIGALITLAKGIGMRDKSPFLPVKSPEIETNTWVVPGIVEVSLGFPSTETKSRGMILERFIVWTEMPDYLTAEYYSVSGRDEQQVPFGKASTREVKVKMKNGDILDLVEYSADVMRNDSKQHVIIKMLIDPQKLWADRDR